MREIHASSENNIFEVYLRNLCVTKVQATVYEYRAILIVNRKSSDKCLSEIAIALECFISHFHATIDSGAPKMSALFECRFFKVGPSLTKHGAIEDRIAAEGSKIEI